MFPEVLPYWNKSLYKNRARGLWDGLAGPRQPPRPICSGRICYTVAAGLSQVKSFKRPILYLSRLPQREQMSGIPEIYSQTNAEGKRSSVRPGEAGGPAGADLVALSRTQQWQTVPHNERPGYSSLQIQI